MRFLIFNFVAVLAVGYLVFGQDVKPGALIDRFTSSESTETDIQQDSSLQETLRNQVAALEEKLQASVNMQARIDALEAHNADLQQQLQAAQAADAADKNDVTQQEAGENPLAHMAGSTEPAIEEGALGEGPGDETVPQEVAALSNEATGDQPQDGTSDQQEQQMSDETAPQFLTPKERRRELQLLSLDLEEMYIRSLNQ